MTSDIEVIGEVNEALARGDLGALSERLHLDAVWEHNIPSSSSSFATGCSRGAE